ncbi:alpha-glucosidase [Ideonella azotifigens]|uniref:Alpha glucosidase n=2 Tax=Ideonella azotifigens TaxID=513160 RepID=A0ABN1JKG0_9BURK|nr:alpha-amylase family glycosyl hydrolase [Ideonella azotifigens]MCD2341852.1 alpha-glucosidase [Ideonella azotifigens]
MQQSSTDPAWWRGGALYQVYPRSFQDSNGDGIGDLPGVTQRLPYIASLGVEGLWISPFFKSPMRDFGYDVSDYCDVDPIFGTLADFDTLVTEAHALNLRVLIDLVISHTSTEHPWFQQSRVSRDNPKADWYVWADPQPDGSPPNNWLSIFGGSAWQWESRRKQYYLHNFLSSQPDLNFHNEDVQQAVLDVAEFWLKRGVDGFRLDTVNFYVHDKQLRSNPPQPAGHYAVGVPHCNPYALQQHVYDKSQPENLPFLERLRALMDRYPGTATIGEIGDDHQYERLAEYTRGQRLHMAYTFNLLGHPCSPAFIHSTLQEFVASTEGAWACWSLNNHDVDRVVTRWQPLGEASRIAPVLLGLLASLRGSPCLYQGEELGLAQAELPFSAIQDPYGKEMWPDFPGRDGCRTPMPWQAAAPHAGFSTATPWLPVAEPHLSHAVDRQEGDDQSLLAHYRRFLHWRRGNPLLRSGEMALLPAHEQVVAFVRHEAGEPALPAAEGDTPKHLVCAFNLSPLPARYELPAGTAVIPVNGHGFIGSHEPQVILLPPHQAFFGHLVPQSQLARSASSCPASNSETSPSDLGLSPSFMPST